MGCDIHSFAEVRKDGKWERVKEPVFSEKTTQPFAWRSYSVFAFLAGVRNYSNITPLSEPKGLPTDSEHLNTLLDEPEEYVYQGFDNGTASTIKGAIECDADYHSLSFLTLKELVEFDYDKTFEDLRTVPVMKIGNTVLTGAAFSETAKEGEGKKKTVREYLREGFFEELEIIKSLGNREDVRIIFWFDN